MPGMTGVELQTYLLERGHDVPIIFITAFPEERIRLKVHAAGAIAFLSKPFDGDAMMQCIDEALRQRSAATRH
jgi:FixJ family two-component response regulator